MKDFKEEKTGSQITIWDDEKRVGLKFTEGERLQAYTAELIVDEPERFCQTEEGIKTLSDISDELTEYATKKYPKEFAPLKD